MGVSVFGDRNKAALYDNTSGATIGYIYRGYSNAERELRVFVNQWLEQSPRDLHPDELADLQIAYKVERGFADRKDWLKQVERAEEILGREILEDSFEAQ